VESATPTVAIALTAVVFGGVGTVCLLWPTRIQQCAIKSQVGWAGKMNPLKGFLSSPMYLGLVRAVGVLSMFVALVAIVRLFVSIPRLSW